MESEYKDKVFETEIGGRKLVVKTGKLARQANASCLVQYGETTILATTVMSEKPREGIDFFPLMVDLEEKFYSVGKVMGSRFVRRERQPSDRAVLTGRLIDRSIRPYFNKKMLNDVQVGLTVMSMDMENAPDMPGLLAASIVLAISDIPWAGPIAGVKVGRVDGEWVLDPTIAALENSELELVVAGTKDRVIMLEAGAKETKEDIMYEGIAFAQTHIGNLVKFIEEIVREVGKPKREMVAGETEEEGEGLTEAYAKTKEFMDKELEPVLFNQSLKSKMERKAALDALNAKLEAELKAQQVGKEKRAKAHELAHKMVYEAVTKAILDKEQRVDGRQLDEIRPLESEVDILPRVHGSGLFRRGATQVLSIVTLGGPSDEQLTENIEIAGIAKKRFMHHYNFPSFATGECGALRINRRSIGHGALAEKALIPVLPSKEEFPYIIRIVSEVLGSNGSSSMGSTCGSTLSLMDAGVPIKRPVAGIAMGLASEENEKEITKYKILTDLQDMEDGEGGMDFKVAGTSEGITAIQLDTKTHGLSMEIVKETLNRALTARLKILDVMKGAIAETRPDLSSYAPRIACFKIDPARIGEVIGPGGKMINKIIEETGVEINVDDDGTVCVTSNNPEGSDKAVQWIKDLVHEVKPGELYEGVVTQLMDFGAFVRILPGKEGLIHISKLANHHVEKVEDVVHVGDKVKVEVFEIDSQHRINLKIQGVISNSSRPPRSGAGRDSDRPRRPSGGRSRF